MAQNFNAELDEFTNNTSFEDKWRTVCDKISTLNFSDQNEDLSFLKCLLIFLQKLNNSTNYLEHLGDPQEKEYFFSEVLLICSKNLLKIENPFSELLEVSNSCLEEMVLFWIKAIYEDHPKLTEMVKIIFDIDNHYHKVNNQEHIVPKVIASFNREPSQEHTDWINTLKKDDMIDCIDVESPYNLICWSHAQVIEVTPQSIVISYIGGKDIQKTLEKVANANEIAPYKTKCKDFDWRMGLDKGDEVDICDNSDTSPTYALWFNGTVVDTRVCQVNGKTFKRVLIGYRVYNELGNRIDEEGKNFFGWSSSYDEWINLESIRLRRKGVMAKTFSLISSQTDNKEIEDSNDLVYSVEGVKIFAITRPKYCKSVMVVRIINKFGEAGGFDRILERISDTEKWAPIEIVSQIVSLIAKINPVLYREFIKEYVPKLWEAVWENLMKSPESNIRNFTKERINDIKNGLEELLKRIYSLPEKINFIEKLCVGISVIWPDLILKATAAQNDDFNNNKDYEVDVPIGPFTKEMFNPEKWRTITAKIEESSENVLPFLKELLKLLKELNTCPDYNHYFGDLSIKDFFFTDFFPTATKILMEIGVLNNSIALDLIDNCLEQLALFWIKTIEEDHQKLMEVALRIFDTNANYYKANNQEEIIPGIIPSFNKASQEHINWINSLKIGGLVDCVKVTYKLMCWSHAKVIDVTPNMITVSYLNERDTYNKSLAKIANVNEIAPYQSKCNDFEWRFSIKKGDIIDVCTPGIFCGWFYGTVLDERQTKIDGERTIKEILVGYSKGQKYHGKSIYDEWIPVTDSRISKKDNFSKRFFEYTGPIASDPVIQDSNDNIYFVKGSKIYAITRPGYCRSLSLVKIINKFGEAGGFDRILQRISKAGNSVPLEIVGQMVKLIGGIDCVLYREFTQEYVPKLWEAFVNYLEEDITTRTENFDIDDTKALFNKLLKRIYDLPEKNKILEEMLGKLNLCVCSAFLNSNIRECKLKGLDLLKKLAIQNDYRLNSFISQNLFLTKIFGSKVDFKLIQRNEELLRFLIRQDKLNDAEFQDIINLDDKKEPKDFPKEKWNVLAGKMSLLNVINQEEAIPIVKEISSFLSELNSSIDYDAFFGDYSVKEYFLEEFLPNFTEYLIQILKSSDSIAFELCYNCFEQIMLFWVKVIPEDNVKFTKMIKFIVGWDKKEDPKESLMENKVSIFCKYLVDWDKKEDFEELLMESNPPFNMKASESHLDWINSLKQGDLIDCLKIHPKSNLICWSHASITDISPNTITILYVGDDAYYYGKTLNKITNANEMALYKTKCKDFVWRNNLKIGDELDVCDTSNIWYNATVLNVREVQIIDGRIIKLIYIGYRIYDEKGNKVDKDENTFFGWGSAYDGWINRTSPRISKKNSFAKSFTTDPNQQHQSILGANDKIYSVDGGKIYAIVRSKTLRAMTTVKLANKFGEAGGFDKILERISNTNTWAPIEVVCQMVAMIGNIGLLLHRDFAQDYIPKLQKAVWENLLKSPDSNLKNFTLKRIEMIRSAFDCLFNRIYNPSEIETIMERLDMLICSVCLDSSLKEVQALGLKIFLKYVKKAPKNRLVTTDYLTSFMSKKSIFNSVETKGLIQFFQRLAELMFTTEKELSFLQLEDIWSFVDIGDNQEKVIMYKILSDIASDLSQNEVNFITEKIHKIPQKTVMIEEIELLFQLNIFCKSTNAARKAVEYFWKILISSSDQLPLSIIDLTLKRFCELVKSENLRGEKVKTICYCVENMLAGQSYLISLNILKDLLGSEYDATIRDILTDLCYKKNLLSSIMENLKGPRNKIQHLEDEKEGMGRPINNTNDDTTFSSSIYDHVRIILFLTTNLKPGFAGLDELYNELCNQPFKDAFYQYSKDILRGRSIFDNDPGFI